MKQEVRKHVLALRDALSSDARKAHNQRVCEQLLPFLKGKIGIYSAIGSEIDVRAVSQQVDGIWAYPKTYQDHTIRFFQVDATTPLQVGPYHILEPQETKEMSDLDILVIPLVAFDEKCNRLGHGAGYYDRYLQTFHGVTIGVAHECQKVDNVYEEPHDIPLDMIITENHIYKK